MKTASIISTIIASMTFSYTASSMPGDCPWTDKEHDSFERYSVWVRKNDPANAAEKIEEARIRRDQKAEKRCAQDEYIRDLDEELTRREEMGTYKYLFEYAPGGVPKVADPLPASPIPQSIGYSCRDESKECFSTENECQDDGMGNLYDCSYKSHAVCVAYRTADETVAASCFSNSNSCHTFCGAREKSFDGQYACFTKCEVL